MPVYTIVCKTCGKTFTASRGPKDKLPIYCSKQCHYNTPEIRCAICGKIRKVKASAVDRTHTCGNWQCYITYKRSPLRATIENTFGEPIKAILERLYFVEHKSYRYICKTLGINTRTLMKMMDENGLFPRDRSEAVKTQWENNDDRRKSIGKVFSESGKKRRGPLHPCWRGGITKKYDTPEWVEYAKTIRARDGLICQHCGVTNDKCFDLYGKSLDVHHIIPFRLSSDDSPQNLTTLCPVCHKIADTEFKWLL